MEHEPLEILAYEVIGAALARANLTAANLARVGITNQRETTLLWDKHTGAQPRATRIASASYVASVAPIAF